MNEINRIQAALRPRCIQAAHTPICDVGNPPAGADQAVVETGANVER